MIARSLLRWSLADVAIVVRDAKARGNIQTFRFRFPIVFFPVSNIQNSRSVSLSCYAKPVKKPTDKTLLDER